VIHGKTVAGAVLQYNNNTGDKNRNANRSGKYADRLEMFVQNMHDYDVLT
jgi:hypothetical protein